MNKILRYDVVISNKLSDLIKQINKATKESIIYGNDKIKCNWIPQGGICIESGVKSGLEIPDFTVYYQAMVLVESNE